MESAWSASRRITGSARVAGDAGAMLAAAARTNDGPRVADEPVFPDSGSARP
jgi:hypothetical protein